jgi:hypothetical protein
MAMLTNTKFVERCYHFRSVMMKGEDASPFSSPTADLLNIFLGPASTVQRFNPSTSAKR